MSYFELYNTVNCTQNVFLLPEQNKMFKNENEVKVEIVEISKVLISVYSLHFEQYNKFCLSPMTT